MDSTVVAVFLPAAISLVMIGLGLTLTVEDFTRVLRQPRAALVSLGCQILLLPAVALGLVFLFGLSGALAAGTLLLAASPGGSTATVFSHLAGGDVALNVTLAAVNAVLAVFTVPLVVGLATAGFLGGDARVGLEPVTFLQIVALLLIPVALGMAVRHRFTAWAERMRGAVKVVSLVVLTLVILGALAGQFQDFLRYLPILGPITLSLSVLGMAFGYFVPRLFRVPRAQSIASTMEIGVHNVAVAITIAVSVLGDERMALPAGMYGILMYLPVTVVALGFARRGAAVAA